MNCAAHDKCLITLVKTFAACGAIHCALPFTICFAFFYMEHRFISCDILKFPLQ